MIWCIIRCYCQLSVTGLPTSISLSSGIVNKCFREARHSATKNYERKNIYFSFMIYWIRLFFQHRNKVNGIHQNCVGFFVDINYWKSLNFTVADFAVFSMTELRATLRHSWLVAKGALGCCLKHLWAEPNMAVRSRLLIPSIIPGLTYQWFRTRLCIGVTKVLLVSYGLKCSILPEVFLISGLWLAVCDP